MRPSFHCLLINGPFDDPGLLVHLTFQKQALLFDLGDLSAVSTSDLLKINRIFVTHTHMDHFIGFDRVLRLLLGRSKRLHLYGPKGFLGNVAGKLAAYTWNLVHNYEEALVLEATEIDGDLMISQTFDCRTGFRPSATQRTPTNGQIVHHEPALSVRATLLDHQIPCLAFCLQERFHVNILKTQLEELGLSVGPWLNAFKALLFAGADPTTEVSAPSAGPEKGLRIFALEALATRIVQITRGQKIAYVSDAVYNSTNIEKIVSLALGADHLFIEAAFLDEDRDIAQSKFHLTARQAGLIARTAEVRQMTIFHHSPRYIDQAHLLEEEAQRAFKGQS
ncbi:MAG: ribonuclease Z [Desulfatitalea sp.]